MESCTLRKKCSYSEFFWSTFSRIWRACEEIRNISPYPVRMRENTDRENLRIRTLFAQWPSADYCIHHQLKLYNFTASSYWCRCLSKAIHQITRNFERFHDFSFKASLRKAFFKKLDYGFLVESTAIESGSILNCPVKNQC